MKFSSIALKRAEEKLEIQRKLREYTKDLEKEVKIATKVIEAQVQFHEKAHKKLQRGYNRNG